MKKTKVVITGGAGFIGSHVAKYWVDNNADVHVIDNLRTGYYSNIKEFQSITFHKGSITDRELIFNVLKDTSYVHHFAAFVSVPDSISKPEECYDININGLLNLLDASKEFGIERFIYSSSAAVYGDNPETPKTINTKPMPKSPYAETKLEGENYLKLYQEMSGLGTISLRYFNVFGPKQDPNSQYAAAIPIFIKNAILNEPIIIYGDGNQTRDFIFVEDVVQANIQAVTSSNVNGIFNVASGKAITINDIARTVIEQTESKSEIIYKNERSGDIKHSLASIEQTTLELGFFPKYDLKKGLIETINYFLSIFK
jgi:UDP-glucose 4-epimerase